MKTMSRKLGVILFYTVCWLSYYQVVDIIRTPSQENLIKVAWSLFAGTLLAYVMGFDLKFRLRPKKIIAQEDNTEAN